MHFVTRCFIVACMLISLPGHAKWNDSSQAIPEPKPIATEIAAEIEQLPEPALMTPDDTNKVSQILDVVLQEQEKQIVVFQQHINQHHDTGTPQTWFDLETSYLTLNSLALSKQHLLELVDPATRNKLTGFGPKGVKQFKQELTLTKLHAQDLLHFKVRTFKALARDLLISPIPAIWICFKIIFIYFVLAWWLTNSKRIIELFRRSQFENSIKPPLWVRLIWYVSRAHRAIAWLIAITLSLRVLAGIPSLQHLVFLEIFTWWILGGSIAISFILEFTYRNSRTSGPEISALLLSTIRRYVWSAIIAGVISQISLQTLGKGTIYHWIYSALFLWFVVVTISVLHLWRTKVFDKVMKISEYPVWVKWAVSRKDTFLLNIIATFIAVSWLTRHTLKYKVVAQLSNYYFFNQLLAHLFRIEVTKQTNNSDEQHKLVRVRGNATFDYVVPGNVSSELVDYAGDEVKQLSRYLLTDSPAVCVLSGERGIGTTTVLGTLLNRVKNAEPVYLSCPYSGYKELLVHLAVSIGLNEEASEIQILAHLRKSDTTYLIAIDNAQRLIKPMVDGLSELIRITNLLRRSKKNHRVVFAIEKASWRFVDRARGERLLFDLVTFMPRWSEKQIGQLLDTRINQNDEYRISFEGLMVPKQWDQEEITEEERAKQGFYRILWHYSDGNPTVALRFFRLSLHRDKDTQQVYVRLFKAPDSQELEKMPKPMLAVLRSIVQLEVAAPEVLSECTQLTIAEITGILRYFQSRGFIEWAEDKARISDHWFRHITNVLDRQHLLVK